MRVRRPYLFLIGLASLGLSIASGCGDGGARSSGSTGGNADKGGSGVAGQSGRGGSTGTGGGGPASGGAGDCGRCDASMDGGAIGTGGAGGSTPVQADVAWPDSPEATGGVPGTGGAAAGGAGGELDGGAGEYGGSHDSAMDGTGGIVDGSEDGPACITLADIPTVQVRTADSSTRLVALAVQSGPCDGSSAPLRMTVEFHYWEKGYSCPRLNDKVTCEIGATSSAGATTIFTVEFTAVPLSATTLYWQPQSPEITVTFPPLDGGGLDGDRQCYNWFYQSFRPCCPGPAEDLCTTLPSGSCTPDCQTYPGTEGCILQTETWCECQCNTTADGGRVLCGC
jgi:hypothetical protein